MFNRLGLYALCLQFLSASAQTQGMLKVLSYNVAGLPELLSSGETPPPPHQHPPHLPRLAPYNIINVEEDLNLHAALYASDTHAYRTPTSSGAGIGSGLNTLSDYSYIDLNRGFTVGRVKIADRAWVDVYSLHTDAGSDAGDIAARVKSLAQLGTHIDAWSAGMPVVVMGDTNSRYTRDSDALHSFLSSTGTTDLWVQDLVACEVVDKIFIRSSPAFTFFASMFTNEHYSFVNVSGYPLSDHYPIRATLSWRVSTSLRLADAPGGPHGTAFNDIPALLTTSTPKLTSVTIRSANRVDAVSYTVKYASGATSTVSHGGTSGTAYTLTLNAGERVIQTYTCTGNRNERFSGGYLFYLSLLTNQGRTLAAGKTTGECATVGVPADASAAGTWELVAFWEREGDEVDKRLVIIHSST
ncbi:hypothetical protein M422DRAFT_61881 [Sphaerobolus stellatus SS14]|uniref:Endonuclease/exonuclease/phosphatase domain-containing protein n=1 Tax=Sphaerobolus stellatus (strain SS14) TaxID=990650 RepID=A0A0C9UU84_SPHS4|nr:hypothetical protein M422DRAFT_61881 [Sphaerobolus stellatus SS14]